MGVKRKNYRLKRFDMTTDRVGRTSHTEARAMVGGETELFIEDPSTTIGLGSEYGILKKKKGECEEHSIVRGDRKASKYTAPRL